MIEVSPSQIKEQFLKKFAEELIFVRKMQIEAEKKAKREEERLNRAIEAEKLKMKYAPARLEAEEAGKKTGAEAQKLQGFKPTIYRPMPVMRQPVVQQAIPVAPLPQMNFGRIEQFIRDIYITSIECPGVDKEVIIKKSGQVMTTDIRLSKEEIDAIIADFSEKARIPLIEGLLRARIANLQISAVVSKIAESRFIITKFAAPASPASAAAAAHLNQITRGLPGQLQPPPTQLAMPQGLPPMPPAPPAPPASFMPGISRPFVSRQK